MGGAEAGGGLETALGFVKHGLDFRYLSVKIIKRME